MRKTIGRLLGLIALLLAAVLAVRACQQGGPPSAPLPEPPSHAPPASPPALPPVAHVELGSCDSGAFATAARANAASLRTLAWAPFRRPEIGWETYAPMIAHEIGSPCPTDSSGFAAALSLWQGAHGQPARGEMSAASFDVMKGLWQQQRPFVRLSARGICPAAPPEAALAFARVEEGYGGKRVQLRPGALDAYRRMVAAARAENPAIAADPQALTIFSAYRSPASDAARCAREGNCQGITRAACSAHRTGLAMDVVVGAAPGFPVDSSADPNRLAQSRSPAYRWLVANAGRFGFAPYVFEPWHWEWTGEAP